MKHWSTIVEDEGKSQTMKRWVLGTGTTEDPKPWLLFIRCGILLWNETFFDSKVQRTQEFFETIQVQEPKQSWVSKICLSLTSTYASINWGNIIWLIWDILHCSLPGRFYPSMLLYLNWRSPFYRTQLAPLRASNLLLNEKRLSVVDCFFVVDVKSTACFAVGVFFSYVFFMCFLFVVGWGVVPRCCVCSFFFWGGSEWVKTCQNIRELVAILLNCVQIRNLSWSKEHFE